MNPLIEYPRTQDLAYWINTREAMRMAKEAGAPPPWSIDPAMASVRYCNVHREDDKVTRWLRSNPVYSRHDIPVWIVVASRMVNRISTLMVLEPHFADNDISKIKQCMKDLRADGVTIWGNAYTISTCGRSMDKIDYVFDHVVQAVKEDEEERKLKNFSIYASCDNCFKWLTSIDGLGSFLAGQVVADLKNMQGHPLNTAPDFNTFAVHGPGSLRGLEAFYGTPATPSNFKTLLGRATGLVTPFLCNYVAPIHAQDMQNCFCEFSKFIRFQEGGHVRNRYVAHN
jgi:hypothetical protein